MTYTPQPQASGSTLSGTRDQIRTNFEIIETDFAIDHVQFDNTGEGKHNKSTYVELVNPNEPATIANETAIWSAVGASSGKSELYIRQESQSGALQVGIRDFAIYGVTAAGVFNSTGGVLGNHNINLNATHVPVGLYNMTFDNDPTNLNYIVLVTPENGVSLSFAVTSKATTGFSIRFNNTSGTSVNPTSFSVMVYGEMT